MFKFLLYLFLIYIVVRFLFGRFFGSTIKVKTFNYHAQLTRQPVDEKPEGTVVIETEQAPKKPGSDKNLGEYVDFEEVK